MFEYNIYPATITIAPTIINSNGDHLFIFYIRGSFKIASFNYPIIILPTLNIMKETIQANIN